MATRQDSRWVWVAGSIAVLSALAVLAVVLRRLGDSWALSIQATATVTLVLITAAYAYSTRQLVAAQRRGPYDATFIQGAIDLMEMFNMHLRMRGRVDRIIPRLLAAPEAPNTESLTGLEEAVNEFDDFWKEASLVWPRVPAELQYEYAWALHAVGDTLTAAKLLQVLLEEWSKTASDWRHDDLRAAFYSTYRNKIPGRPEWEAILDGEYLSQSAAKITTLAANARNYLTDAMSGNGRAHQAGSHPVAKARTPTEV